MYHGPLSSAKRARNLIHHGAATHASDDNPRNPGMARETASSASAIRQELRVYEAQAIRNSPLFWLHRSSQASCAPPWLLPCHEDYG